MNDLARMLAERGIRVASTSDGQHRTTCPACSAQRKKARDPCLAVEISEDGTRARYLCHHCGMSGGAGGEVRDMRPRKTYRRPQAPVAMTDRNGDEEMIAWFRARGISDDTMRAFGIHRARHWFPQLGEERACLAFPYRWRGELTNVKYRARVIDDGKETKTFAQEKDAEPTLYNADEIQGDELVIVEGEMDVLACWEAGLRSVVSLPNGAAKSVDLNGKRLDALEAHADTLADVKRVVIATDADEPGAALAEALSLRFGRDRCWRVRWPDGIKDANELLIRAGAEALRAAISSAAPWPVDGVHQPHEFASEVDDIYFGRVAKPLSCGIRELDALWRIVPGTFNVVTGIPNHGKSMFVDQVAVNLAQRSGWNFAVFSPEHSPARHLARLAEKLIGKPFDDGPTTRMTHRELRDAIDWLDARFTFVRSTDAAPTIDWLIERFRWCAVRRGVNGIVIDPYNEIEASRGRDQTETEFVSLLISKLKRFAAAHGATVFMVVHPTKLKRQDDGSEPIPSLYDLAGCHSSDTEVLTARGWIRHADVSLDDRVACFDLETEALSYERPSKLHRYAFAGEMHRFKGYSLDLLVTPDHRMVVRPSWHRRQRKGANPKIGRPDAYPRDRWSFVTAKALTTAHWSMPMVPRPFNEGKHVDRIDLDDGYPALQFMQFLGWWIAEGSISGNGLAICQAQGPKAEAIRSIMDALGLDRWEKRAQQRPNELPMWLARVRARKHPELCEWMIAHCGEGAADKRLPSLVWGMTPALKLALFDALMDGDGHERPHNPRRIRQGGGVYSTTSKLLADDVQRLAIELGRYASVKSTAGAKPHHLRRYWVTIGHATRRTRVILPRNRVVERYDGEVFCLTVPTGAYITRRNGTMAITGNSAHWRNKADSGVIIHRDFAADRTQVHVRKIREQPAHGTLGVAELVFDARQRRLVGIDGNDYRNRYDGEAS